MSRKSDSNNLNRTWTLMPECDDEENLTEQPVELIDESASLPKQSCTSCETTRRSIVGENHLVVSSRLFLEDVDKESFDLITKSIDSLFDRVNEWNYGAVEGEQRQPGIDDDWAFDCENFLIDYSACNSPALDRKNPASQQGVNNVTINLDSKPKSGGANETICLVKRSMSGAMLDGFKNQTFDAMNNQSNVDDEGMDVDDEDAEILLLSNKSKFGAKANDDLDLDVEGGDLPKSFNASSIPKTFDLFLNDLKNSSVVLSRPTSPNRLLSSSQGKTVISGSGVNGAGFITNGLARCSVNMKVMTSSIDTDLNKAVSIGAKSSIVNPALSHLNKENIKTSSPFQSASSGIPQCLNRSYTKEKPSSAAPTIEMPPLSRKDSNSDAPTNIVGANKLRSNVNRKAFNSNESLDDYCDTSSRSSSDANCRDDNLNITNDIIIGQNNVNIDANPNNRTQNINKTYEAGGNNTHEMICDYDGQGMNTTYEPVVFNTTYSSWDRKDQAETLSRQNNLPKKANATMVLNKTQDLNNNSYHEPAPSSTYTPTPASSASNELNKTKDIIDSDDLDSNPDENTSSKKSSVPSPSSQKGSKLVRPNIENTTQETKTRVSLLPSISKPSKLAGPSSFQKQQSFPAPSQPSSGLKSPNTRLSLAPTSTKTLPKQETIDAAVSDSAKNDGFARPKSFVPKSRFGFQSVSSAASVNSNNNSNVAHTSNGNFKVPSAVNTSPTHSSLTTSNKLPATSRYSIGGKPTTSSVSSTTSLSSVKERSAENGQKSPSGINSTANKPTTTINNLTKSKLATPSVYSRVLNSAIPTSSSTSSIKSSAPTTSTSESKLANKSPTSDNQKSAINKPLSMIPSFKNSSSVQNFRYSTGYAIRK